jgi:hypothetical protein
VPSATLFALICSLGIVFVALTSPSLLLGSRRAPGHSSNLARKATVGSGPSK